ncbi:MAG TPA: HAMP domain-containing sensor histidine kinase [Pyrinomonadaceae bacterium]
MAETRPEVLRLGALLRAERDELLARWRGQVRLLPNAAGLDVPALNDHVPDLLEELACELEASCDPDRLPTPVTDNPEVHGLQRFEVGFDVGEIVAEYGLLRACVQDLAEERGLSFCGDAARVVGGRIDKAIRRAVETYVSYQREETRRRREEHLAFVAHDLKTPLSAVDMASRLLESDLTEESKSGRNRMLLETLRRNVGRLGALVKAVVREDMRFNADAEMVLRRREFDLWPLVQGLVYDLRPLAAPAGVKLVNAVPEDLTVCADAPALSQVFQNLLSNAIRYAPGGTVTAGARALEGGGVECRVSDTGEGIEEGRLSKVFEKGETDGRAGGTGLGLAIVRQVVEAHGGRVRAESRTGEGTTFVFDIPGESPADNAASVTGWTGT